MNHICRYLTQLGRIQAPVYVHFPACSQSSFRFTNRSHCKTLVVFESAVNESCHFAIMVSTWWIMGMLTDQSLESGCINKTSLSRMPQLGMFTTRVLSLVVSTKPVWGGCPNWACSQTRVLSLVVRYSNWVYSQTRVLNLVVSTKPLWERQHSFAFSTHIRTRSTDIYIYVMKFYLH